MKEVPITCLSTGQRVSERISELLDEVCQRDLVPVEIVLGSRAFELLMSELQFSGPPFAFAGYEITTDYAEIPEYVGIECQS
jgi:hypothetical protein